MSKHRGRFVVPSGPKVQTDDATRIYRSLLPAQRYPLGKLIPPPDSIAMRMRRRLLRRLGHGAERHTVHPGAREWPGRRLAAAVEPEQSSHGQSARQEKSVLLRFVQLKYPNTGDPQHDGRGFDGRALHCLPLPGVNLGGRKRRGHRSAALDQEPLGDCSSFLDEAAGAELLLEHAGFFSTQFFFQFCHSVPSLAA